MPCVYIGVDISKAFLDLHDPARERSWRLANTPDGIAGLLSELPADCHLVFEATSVCDVVLRARLTAAGVPFTRINPSKARHFAKFAGFLAKTDKVDAVMLAALGATWCPPPTVEPSPARGRLSVLITRRAQLVDMRARERCRVQQLTEDDADGLIAQSLTMLIATLGEAIDRIERAMRHLIRATPELAALDETLRAVPGIGDINAAVLIAGLPELGSRNRRQIAGLAGLAPYAADSGTWRGKRKIQGGRRAVRRALYIAAVTGRRRGGDLARTYDRLLDAGKPPKVAMIAVARKLLVRINATVREGTEYKTSTA